MEKLSEVTNFLNSNIHLSLLSKYIPVHLIEEFKRTSVKRYRERVYSLEVTLKGMLYQAINTNKSDQNTVIFLQQDFQALQIEHSKQELELSSQLSNQLVEKKRGRPRKAKIKIQKSKLGDISVYPSSYNESKHRFPLALLEQIAYNTAVSVSSTNKWHGHNVYIADGTNLDTPDTKELRDYFMPNGIGKNASLPIVKLEALIDLYTGLIVAIAIDGYQSSESRLLKTLYERIPDNTILLADDLYATHAHLCYCKKHSCDMIVRGKHKHIEPVIREFSSNDKIVEWTNYKQSAWYGPEDELQKKIQVRKITFIDPLSKNKKLCLYTTLLDAEKYKAEDIISLFRHRWDIEICFREIKKVMQMEHLRSQSVEMIKKEILVYWIAYNLIRIIMYNVYTAQGEADFFSL